MSAEARPTTTRGLLEPEFLTRLTPNAHAARTARACVVGSFVRTKISGHRGPAPSGGVTFSQV